MCELTTLTLVGMAVSAAGAVYMHNEQQKANAEMAEVQQQQINAQAAQKTQDRMAEARALRAQARAAAAEAGVAGNSVDIFLNDIMGQAGRDAALIETNRRNGVEASAAEESARSRSATAEMYGGLANTAASGYGNYVSAKKLTIAEGG